MSKWNLKLVLAGALVACGFAVGIAWASPGQGITSTSLVGPVQFEEFDTMAHAEDWKVRVKTQGISDVYVTHIKVAPGGFSGWHSHPGPSLISVKAGTATIYCACEDPIEKRVYAAGNGFVEDAGCVHQLANEGDVDLEVIVLQIVPKGAPRRIEEADPRN